MSYGEQAVGLTFNPSNNKDITDIKKMFAAIIDFYVTKLTEVSDNETKRLYDIAITEAQTAQMWAVKAITWSSN